MIFDQKQGNEKHVGEPIIYQGKHIGWKTDHEVDPLNNSYTGNHKNDDEDLDHYAVMEVEGVQT